jgi:transposase-like protein
MVRQLELDLPKLSFFSFSFPRQLWRKLRSTSIIERYFLDVRRRTVVCVVKATSLDRIIYRFFTASTQMEVNALSRLYSSRRRPTSFSLLLGCKNGVLCVVRCISYNKADKD